MAITKNQNTKNNIKLQITKNKTIKYIYKNTKNNLLFHSISFFIHDTFDVKSVSQNPQASKMFIRIN